MTYGFQIAITLKENADIKPTVLRRRLAQFFTLIRKATGINIKIINGPYV